MKKALLFSGGVALLCLLLVVRLFFKQSNDMSKEREWFVKGLQYEFSAQIEGVQMITENSGRLWCRVTSGNPQTYREDSLKSLFKEHDRLFFIFRQSGDSILFLFPKSTLVREGDSVHVSSERNTIQFFRDRQPVVSEPLTNTVMGFSRPFFLKKKTRKR